MLTFSFDTTKYYPLACMFFIQHAYAANFSIEPYGTLPTSALPNQTVAAYFNLSNNTHSKRNGYSIQGLPENVRQNTAPGYC